MDDWNLDEIYHLVHGLCNIINLQSPNSFTRNKGMMLGLRQVLVTLHGQFTISVEQDK